MKTCFSSLRLLSSRIDRYRLVHSSEVVMIMLPPPLVLHCRRYRRPCRHRRRDGVPACCRGLPRLSLTTWPAPDELQVLCARPAAPCLRVLVAPSCCALAPARSLPLSWLVPSEPQESPPGWHGAPETRCSR